MMNFSPESMPPPPEQEVEKEEHVYEQPELTDEQRQELRETINRIRQHDVSVDEKVTTKMRETFAQEDIESTGKKEQ